MGQALEVVGGLAHGRDDHDDVVALTAGGDDVVGDRLDPLGAVDRRAAVLLHDQAHLHNGTSGVRVLFDLFRRAPTGTICAGSVDSALVSKAAKRERQRQNRESRRQIEQQIERRQRTFKTVRNFAILAVPVLIVGVILAASGGGDTKPASAGTEYATLTTSKGVIVVQLFPKEAPKSEAQFVRLANKGFYNGLKFHRVSSSTGIIQSGDPKGDGTGGSGKTVKDELPKTAYQIGDFAFANSGPNTSDSQFFIVTGDPGTKLPLSYNRFGKVIAGLDVAQTIEALSPASGDGAPTEEVQLQGITISKKRPSSSTTTTTAPGTVTTAPASTAATTTTTTASTPTAPASTAPPSS
jgi:cyclophilin family peptidyl-prolyl cis-trans isomerase